MRVIGGTLRRTPGARPLSAAWLGALAMVVALGGPAGAQEPADGALIEALRGGGYTIYFRHAQTDWRQNDKVESVGDWTSCDPREMRQLADSGRATARRIGRAIRALKIPVDTVLSSEYCRAAETARLLDLGLVMTTRDIMNMRAADFVGGRDAVIRRAQSVLSRPPPPGANVVIVGHGNLMRAATGVYAGEAGSAVFAPASESDAGFALVAELSPADWTRLATRFAAP